MIKDFFSRRINVISLVIATLIITGACFFSFFGAKFISPKIVGVQIITSNGTVIIGRNKYSKNLNVWLSPQLGWFTKDGKPNFFQIKHKKDKSTQKYWEIVWEWDELYLNDEQKPLMKFAPSEEEKNVSIETLSSLCNKDNAASLSCHWNISNKISLEALTKNYVCVSDLSGEFYGGAHPIALRRFGTYSIQNKKFVRFDEFIPDPDVQDAIWEALYKNINGVMEQSIFGDLSSSSPAGGMDTMFAPNGTEFADPLQTPRQKLTSILGSQGYTFSPNVFCPAVRPDGPFLLFGFPHSEQVNRGLNYRAEAVLDQPKLPAKVLSLFEDYKYSKPGKDGLVSMLSRNQKWKLSQDFNKLSVSEDGNKIKLALPSDEGLQEEILGVFWVYKSPSLSSLQKYKFKKLQVAKNQSLVDLSKYIKQDNQPEKELENESENNDSLQDKKIT